MDLSSAVFTSACTRWSCRLSLPQSISIPKQDLCTKLWPSNFVWGGYSPGLLPPCSAAYDLWTNFAAFAKKSVISEQSECCNLHFKRDKWCTTLLWRSSSDRLKHCTSHFWRHCAFKFMFCVFRFNYKTDLIHNVTGSARIIHVFNHTLMKGKTGAVKTVRLPPLEGQLSTLLSESWDGNLSQYKWCDVYELNHSHVTQEVWWPNG